LAEKRWTPYTHFDSGDGYTDERVFEDKRARLTYKLVQAGVVASEAGRHAMARLQPTYNSSIKLR
jgi:hypothetical protein